MIKQSTKYATETEWILQRIMQTGLLLPCDEFVWSYQFSAAETTVWTCRNCQAVSPMAWEWGSISKCQPKLVKPEQQGFPCDTSLDLRAQCHPYLEVMELWTWRQRLLQEFPKTL